jgi:predicted enzyme related to lactoylglutathione lyase
MASIRRMSDPKTPGRIGWHDLAADDAPALRDFYSAVAGWKTSECPMGGYADYVMHAADGSAVAGVCHRRGPNADLPPQWLLYIVVPDLDAALAAALAKGGSLLREPGPGDGYGRAAFLRDPAGAAFALFEPAEAAGG